jgi:integrase
MGCVYDRNQALWLKYKDEHGQWKQKPSGFRLGQEKKARQLLVRVEELIAAGTPPQSDGPLTVRRWAEIWIKEQRDRGIETVGDYEARLRDHVLPVIGTMRLDQVRVSHIAALVAALKNKRKKRAKTEERLAPKTIRHIYFSAHSLFERAVRRDLIASNPCRLERGELPARVDKDPGWRPTAVYRREEVEMLISAAAIAEWRRVFYALLFLTGGRFGEISARRWRDYVADETPLGRLIVSSSFQSKTKREKSTKTGQTREVPVHPTLAAILAEWKLGGWERAMGRRPTEKDLIVPFPVDGEHLDAQVMRRRLHTDLVALGYRTRRQHDTRRTFISLCLSDGARKEILQWVTHGRPRADQMDDYTTLLWAPRCEKVARLKIRLLTGETAAVACVAGTGGTREDVTAGVTGRVTRLGAAGGISKDSDLVDQVMFERETGLGPATLGLGSRCSTN